MTFRKNTFIKIITLLIIATGISFRATWYGDLRLSVATLDTESYINSARNSLFSWESFSGRRLFTTNLIFKLATNEACPLPLASNPFTGEEKKREILPCLENIAVIQNILSMFAWSLLAYYFSKHLQNSAYKILSIGIILLFGFSPQIAEWDSVLNVESMAVSLGVIVLALLVELAHRFPRMIAERQLSPSNFFVLASFLFFLTLWVFTRDVHLYAIITTLAISLPLLFFASVRRAKWFLAAISFLVGAFIWGNSALQNSARWHPSIEHAMNQYIFPYPARVEFMMKYGMPAPNSPQYFDWFQTNANKIYGLFLISHPGFLMQTYLDLSFYLRSDFLQTYFFANEIKYQDTLIKLGEILHPESNAVYGISLFLISAILIAAFSKTDEKTFVWLWLAAWVLLYASVSLTLTLFGDVDGTRRHIYPSVEMFRLFIWMLLFIVSDLAASSAQSSRNM